MLSTKLAYVWIVLLEYFLKIYYFYMAYISAYACVFVRVEFRRALELDFWIVVSHPVGVGN